MRATPMAPFCTESASVRQWHALRAPSRIGTSGNAAAMALPTGVVQAASKSGGAFGTVPMSAYQARAAPRPTATVFTQGMAASSFWICMNSSSDLAWFQRSQLRMLRKFSPLMSRIANAETVFQPNAGFILARLTMGPYSVL